MTTAVVGGGLSGLAAAHTLRRAGMEPVLIERESRLGGLIQTVTAHGCLIECGPDSFLSTKPWLLDLIRELGLQDELMGSNDRERVTYLVRNRRLVPLPEKLVLMAPVEWEPLLASPLLSDEGKRRMREEMRFLPTARAADVSVSEFLGDHYGQEAVEYLAEPLLAGVYGGDPDKLSARSVLGRFVELERHVGSITAGLQAERRAGPPGGPVFQTLRSGLGRLVAALAAQTPTPLVGEALRLERQGSGYRVVLRDRQVEADHVILACPAHRAARLVEPLDPELARLLDAIPYGSSATVALGYDRATLGHPLNGFGFLVPRRERRRVLACTWVGTKWNHRVPAGQAVLRCFLGSVHDPGVLGLPDAEMVALVRDELREVMGITAEPGFHVVSRWPASMPQYVVGHGERLAEIERRLDGLPGLHLAGNAYHGVGLPDSVRVAREAAGRVIQSQESSGVLP